MAAAGIATTKNNNKKALNLDRRFLRKAKKIWILQKFQTIAKIIFWTRSKTFNEPGLDLSVVHLPILTLGWLVPKISQLGAGWRLSSELCILQF